MDIFKNDSIDRLWSNTVELNYGIICDNIKKAYTSQVELKLLDKNDTTLKKIKQKGSFSLTPPFRQRLIQFDELVFDGVKVEKIAKISIMIK